MSEFRQAILDFLKLNPETFYSRKEISKKAVHRSEYEENPHWAVQPLEALVVEGQVEKNDSGFYRLREEGYQSKFEKKY